MGQKPIAKWVATQESKKNARNKGPEIKMGWLDNGNKPKSTKRLQEGSENWPPVGRKIQNQNPSNKWAKWGEQKTWLNQEEEWKRAKPRQKAPKTGWKSVWDDFSNDSDQEMDEWVSSMSSSSGDREEMLRTKMK